MNQETRKCQNCQKEFTIDEHDFVFYEMFKVPKATWCPDCRMQRRLIWRQERALYKRKCDLCNRDIIAMYPEKVKFPVYCVECWLSDKWDATEYAKDYDFSKPFFRQFHELLQIVPRRSLEGHQNKNSPYTNYTWFSKNVYLCSSALYSENTLYSRSIDRDKDCIECAYVTDSELCYQCLDIAKCYNSKYLIKCIACLNSAFLFDCRNCQNCFLSTNLRNKQYVIKNQQYGKEEYQKKMEQLRLSSYVKVLELETEFKNLIKNKAVHRFSYIIKSLNVLGDNVINSKNIINSFDIWGSENLKYCWRAIDIKDAMDIYGAGDHAELLYEGVNVGYKDSLIRFSTNTYENIIDATYCDYCKSSSYLFGCAGLNKKQYYILNKQYTEKEYEKMVLKIVKHMDGMPYTDERGRIYRYGEFFPFELSPFSYNETLAQEYFPLTKEGAVDQGFKWLDAKDKDIHPTIKSEDLPDDIKDVKDSITNEIIVCVHKGRCNEQCTRAFKIIPQELELYRKMNIPIPRICPNCRYHQIFSKRNLPKLYQRKCNKCNKEIQSSYSPDRPEIVYCDECYLKEVI